eukprot:GHVH01004313.1.p1 GENE.GHVH01004313.1~~GHVH01004313.1.p1  ORF type:complete len:419 (-),score=62.54 GHVH01004313.1:78-1334(-)
MEDLANDINTVILFFNCRILLNGSIRRSELWVKGGKVIAPLSAQDADIYYDCLNYILSPGFLDLQINGAFGMDFLLDEDKACNIKRVQKIMLSTGTTGFCPTLITAPPKLYKECFSYYNKTDGDATTGAAILGIHCEGPFLSKKKKGAHPEECIQDFPEGWKSVEKCYGEDLDNVSIVTMACEKENSIEVIENFVKRGIRVSLGHTVATLEDCTAAVNAGANKITHLFNAMPAFHHRDPSVPGLLARAATDSRELYYGIISDGIHTHETAIRLAHRMHPNGMCLVTDAIGPMGQGPGDFFLGTVPCQILSPEPSDPLRAYVTGTTTLCGAICPMDQCIRYAKQFLECDSATVLKCATIHPARCLGISDRKGHLGVGADADFVVLDDDLNVLRTWIGGAEGYRAPGSDNVMRRSNILPE